MQSPEVAKSLERRLCVGKNQKSIFYFLTIDSFVISLCSRDVFATSLCSKTSLGLFETRLHCRLAASCFWLLFSSSAKPYSSLRSRTHDLLTPFSCLYSTTRIYRCFSRKRERSERARDSRRRASAAASVKGLAPPRASKG